MSILATVKRDLRAQVVIFAFVVIIVYSTWSLININIVSTNNATVECIVTDIVSETNGTIREIDFVENGYVDREQVIVQIENDYQVSEVSRQKAELELAVSRYNQGSNNHKILILEITSEIENKRAEVDVARLRLQSSSQLVSESQKSLMSMEINLEYFLETYNRNQKLHEKRIVSTDNLAQSKRNYKSFLSDRDALLENIKSLKSQASINDIAYQNSQRNYELIKATLEDRISASKFSVTLYRNAVEVARSEYRLAMLDLSRTKIEARRAGMVTNKTVASGNYVEIGQPIASIVSCQDSIWIQANFKETQIENMRDGQEVDIRIDTYPGVTFKGYVDSISNGSGSLFSVLPPENATGNFTKVVKRFPVRIHVINDKSLYVLRAGMSAYITVYTDSYDVPEQEFAKMEAP
ncbi:hypothetical protein A9Q81_09860 [Gammaproteobacteria bacterium 42_54_T18]|nr:hypothetical protein A9Q81_09860 [Gammaproteobacteria bacterium 42_54_T18]